LEEIMRRFVKMICASGAVVLGFSAFSGCGDTRLVAKEIQVDTFLQTGEDVAEKFLQDGQQTVDRYTQTGFLQVDTFKQRAAAEIDILWVVDNSLSMSDEQTKLGQNFDDFIKFIDDSDIDYHIGVISSDMNDPNHQGKLFGNPKYIVPNPQAATQFAANVRVGSGGGGNEKGMLAAYRALTDPLLTGFNSGFIRPTASLSVIFVSDEDDNSPGDVEFFRRFFSTYKGVGNESHVIVSAIVGQPPNGGCANTSYGKRFIDLVQSMGGTTGSICDSDFSATLSNLGLTVSGLSRRFELTKDPNWDTMAVSVDSGSGFVPIAQNAGTGWRHNGNEKAIYFDGTYVPPPQSQIKAEYGNSERRFEITGTGDVTTLKVTVNGAEKLVNVDWWYDADNNAVLFNGSYVPPIGSIIEISIWDPRRAFTLAKAVENKETLMVEIDLKQGAGFQLIRKDDVNGWMFDAASNSIRFQGVMVPPIGSELRVSYSNLLYFFRLTRSPDPESITVELDADGDGPGQPEFINQDGKKPGWFYYDIDAQEPFANSVSFEKFPVSEWPPKDSIVLVRYAVVGEF
jgi:hypothetical protein